MDNYSACVYALTNLYRLCVDAASTLPKSIAKSLITTALIKCSLKDNVRYQALHELLYLKKSSRKDLFY